MQSVFLPFLFSRLKLSTSLKFKMTIKCIAEKKTNKQTNKQNKTKQTNNEKQKQKHDQ